MDTPEAKAKESRYAAENPSTSSGWYGLMPECSACVGCILRVYVCMSLLRGTYRSKIDGGVDVDSCIDRCVARTP